MKIFNSLTMRKEELVPVQTGKVGIYACGPTVYNLIHIGNARPLIVFDVLRRYLRYRGEEVIFVQNFTDIDDKIINRASEEGITPAALAQKYISEYQTDARGLSVLPADFHPRATVHIPEIIELISSLVEKGFAYPQNGDVYFRTKKDSAYGKLSHQPLEALEAGARINVNEQKEDVMDFALWKSAKPGEPSWPSPWGDGRPGWHIECSAMASKYLGKTFDIHCGGQDLIFPHHENEIAQSECANGCPFANYWMHNGFININNEKMSKSKGNFFTVRSIAEVYGYPVIRFMMLSVHYRSPMNFSEDVLIQAAAGLNRINNCRLLLAGNVQTGNKSIDIDAYRSQFQSELEDDLNTANAIAVIFDLVRDINTSSTSGFAPAEKEKARQLLEEFCDVLGIAMPAKQELQEPLDAEIETLIEERQNARKTKDFARADAIRNSLSARGIQLLDTPDGVKWKKI